MAKKKRTSDGRKAPRRSPPPVALPSRQAMEAMMQLFASELLQGGPSPDTPLARAQELAYQAFDEPNPARRVELAQEALRLSPDCADAHGILAEHARSRKQALAHYERAVAAGERALGPETFRDGVGYFWGLLETRPYMRARLSLALALWSAAKRDAAIAHLRDMLRLNPNDNQGVRYTLAGMLLFLDRDTELAQLLDRYPERSATWEYARALLAFRQHGDTPATRKRLQSAIKTNRHIPAYLLSTKLPPSAPPDYSSPGDESEAQEYLNGFLAGWKSTDGAIAWVRATVSKPKPAPKAKGPGAAVKKLLNKLPQAETWQCDFRPLPGWIFTDGEPQRPWAVLLTSFSGLVLGHQVSEGSPTPALVWDTLATAMRKPLAGQAHRPATLQVRAGDCWENLRPHLDEIGITVEVTESLEVLDAAFTALVDHVGREERPGLLSVPGMTPERVRGFYDAAAGFFRQTPWKRVGYESAIRVACDKFERGPWFAVLMGQSGLSMGLALYEDMNVLRRMWAGNEDDETNARETVALSVTFSEAWDISTADLDAAATRGWPVARPDGYPDMLRKERGMSMRVPQPWELELMEGCLRVVPDYIARRNQDDATPEEFTVPTAVGPLKLRLSWMVEDEHRSVAGKP